MKSIKLIAGILLISLLSIILITCGGGGDGGGESSTPTLQSIAVTPANPIIPSGATQQFTARGTYSDSTTKDTTSSVTWSSSNAGIATITKAGLATAIAAGSTTITATSGSVSGSTTLTISDVVAVSQKTGPFGAIMDNKDGEMLFPIVDRDASGKTTKVTGALYVNNVTGKSVLVNLGDDGKPTKIAGADFIALFSNWSVDGKTVDIAIIYTPNNYIAVFKGVNAPKQYANSKRSTPIIKTCFPTCGSDRETLAEVIKIAGLGIGLAEAVVATATIATIGAPMAALVFTGVLVNTATFVMGDETWLGLDSTSAAFMSMNGNLCLATGGLDCGAFISDFAARILDIYNKNSDNNSNLVNNAFSSLSNPNQPSGVVQQGSGLPSVPSGQFDCVPGGAMQYEPCLPDGVRACQSNYKYGPCMCGGVPCNALCTSFTYSSWTTCVNNTQSRTITSSSPDGCTGGTPQALTQSCTPQTCIYTYSDWSACQSNNTQTRTVLSSSPGGCTGTPVLTQSCTPQTCTYTYSDWSACSNNTRTRTVTSSSPNGCTGTPVLSQSCTSSGTPGAGNYTQSCTVTGTPITCCAGGTCSTVPAPPSSTYTNSYTVASGTSLSQLTSNVCSQVTAALSSAGCSSWSCNNTAATSNSASFSLSCSVSLPGCTAETVTETCSLTP